MRFRPWIVALVAGVAAFSLHTSKADAQDSPPGVRIADLQDQLENGLKARLPGEFEFIGVVVERVKDRRLSTGEVKSVFVWAQRKNKKVPFPYFERAMRIIAARKGVAL